MFLCDVFSPTNGIILVRLKSYFLIIPIIITPDFILLLRKLRKTLLYRSPHYIVITTILRQNSFTLDSRDFEVFAKESKRYLINTIIKINMTKIL